MLSFRRLLDQPLVDGRSLVKQLQKTIRHDWPIFKHVDSIANCHLRPRPSHVKFRSRPLQQFDVTDCQCLLGHIRKPISAITAEKTSV